MEILVVGEHVEDEFQAALAGFGFLGGLEAVGDRL